MINGRRRDHGAERAHLEVCKHYHVVSSLFNLHIEYVLFEWIQL